MAIASSSPMDTINEVVTTCKIESYFDCLISGRDLPESKPNPTIFLKASEQLRIPVEECLVIEDSYNGIKAGKRANMKVLAIKDKRFSQDVSLADDYQSKPKKDESELEEVVAEEFIRSRKAYGSRKIKKPYQNEAFRSADEKLVES
ncbi:hypothetical protein EfmJHP36_05220 [Enterococcus faecium]|nr:hypothetical protein EfmJHP36_05220 [Enterococcus faecium]